MAIRKDGIKVNRENSDIYRKLILAPTFLFLVEKYKFELFLNTISKNAISRTISKVNKSCKLILEKDNSFGFIKAKKVSIHSPIQIIESESTNLKPFNLLNIKISIIYINIIYSNSMRFSFILLAGGNSNRFKSNLPKPYHKIAGKTLIELSINKVKQFKQFKKIIIVSNKKHLKFLKKINLKNITFVNGGKTRQQSTYNALSYLYKQKKFKKVFIHDAARPNFSLKLIRKILLESKKNNTVIPILKIQDALKEKHNQKKFLNLKRNNFFSTQTPQCFDIKTIFDLHKKNKFKYIDDDLSLIENNANTKLISGEKRNFKITKKEDFEILKNIYKSNLKIGIGFDVHRLVEGRKLFLGGIKIPSSLGTLGHSDGDPVLHALIDAILGACQMGDIGDKFSDKNKKFKNISSSYLLKEVMELIKNKNYVINNLDINIITETPKLKNFKTKITNNISRLCEIDLSKVNVKAKTTEKLGVIGQQKAIASEVIVSLIKYD
jgi:2-C-methyl-D-erythritol 4-phosphate cytidylyltransferase/2-C-methyl-D-erythritol 2,4-cyclodiphosphate synthase